MSVVNSDSIRAGTVAQQGAYTIDQSIRFNDDDSAYMYRTPSVAGNRKTWTFSCWVKRHNLGINELTIFSGDNTSYVTALRFSSDDKLNFRVGDGSASSGWRNLNRVFRDTSAWYHIVAVADTTNATAADRIKIYVNGVEETSFASSGDPSQNLDTDWNSTSVEHRIGRSSTTVYSDFSLADVHFIDGTAYEASDFGEFDANGYWVPVNPSATYGTNGFHIDGADSADFGNDVSDNGNDFTTSGLTSADQMLDSPTDDADNGVGNYCTLNPLMKHAGAVLADGNLSYTGGDKSAAGTIALPEAKIYFEVTPANQHVLIGICDADTVDVFSTFANPDDVYVYYGNTGNKGSGGSYAAYGATFTTEVIGVAFDGVAGTLTFYKSNVSQGTAFTGLTGNYLPFIASLSTGASVLNFGATAFTYTPPTGFKALCTANLPAQAIEDPSAHFQTTLYTGNGTAIGSGGNVITQGGNSTFQPDLVWIKSRDATYSHTLVDSVRGTTKELFSNGTWAEITTAESLSSFNSGGCTLGSVTNVNDSGVEYVAWQWKAGGSASSNTDGSITSSVSANTTAGFSIATYTGSGTAATIGHGLTSAPDLVIVKKRTNDAQSWYTYHSANTSAPETDYLLLDTTAATADLNTIWNDTAPTSSVFSIGTHTGVNDSGGTDTYVAYCWHSVEGFSKFGSVEGNGNADGSFVHLGFRPALVIIKSIDSTSSWHMYDNQREGYNVDNDRLAADDTAVEGTADEVDLLSNGFKLRIATDPNVAETYIYAAFAEGTNIPGTSQARAR